MKIKLYYLISIFCVLAIISCNQKPDIYDILGAKKNTNYNHSKTIRDVKNNFEVNIGAHWKRELYFDDYQSRIYTADTTKSYSSSFIIDITRFKGKIIIEEEFKNQLVSTIQKKAQNYVIKEGFLEFKEKPAYCIYSFEKQLEHVVYTIECYVADGDNYYLLTSTINGSNNLNNNLSETLAIFNSLTPLL